MFYLLSIVLDLLMDILLFFHYGCSLSTMSMWQLSQTVLGKCHGRWCCMVWWFGFRCPMGMWRHDVFFFFLRWQFCIWVLCAQGQRSSCNLPFSWISNPEMPARWCVTTTRRRGPCWGPFQVELAAVSMKVFFFSEELGGHFWNFFGGLVVISGLLLVTRSGPNFQEVELLVESCSKIAREIAAYVSWTLEMAVNGEQINGTP